MPARGPHARVVRLASLTTGAIAAGTDALIEADLAGAPASSTTTTTSTRCATPSRTSASPSSARPRSRRPTSVCAGTLKVAHELERSADLMVNVAKTTWRLGGHALDPTSRRSSSGWVARRACSSAWRSTPLPTVIARGRQRSPTWTRRWTSSNGAVPPHPAARDAATRRCWCGRCSWRSWRVTTNASATTPSPSPSRSTSWSPARRRTPPPAPGSDLEPLLTERRQCVGCGPGGCPAPTPLALTPLSATHSGLESRANSPV